MKMLIAVLVLACVLPFAGCKDNHVELHQMELDNFKQHSGAIKQQGEVLVKLGDLTIKLGKEVIKLHKRVAELEGRCDGVSQNPNSI